MSAITGQTVAEERHEKSHCCSFCGAEKGDKMLFLCCACQSAHYCGKKRQAIAWGQHKPMCEAIQALSRDVEEPIPEPRPTDTGK